MVEFSEKEAQLKLLFDMGEGIQQNMNFESKKDRRGRRTTIERFNAGTPNGGREKCLQITRQ